MSDIVIKVDGLGKQYQLGVIGTGTLSHDLNRWWAKVRGKEDPYLLVDSSGGVATDANFVWAFRDVSFELNAGDVLGIFGKNGAGKSTMLKILSQVTTPTTGTAKVKGRIASLLEVGTGFHPELTGRENVYLNGAILGMTHREIRTRFDEIVEFSGVSKFIDTPVKRYSSGMKVRLGFAVAAHLEPEILIIDEVLAVGDADFQKKCLGKMKDVSGQGRTVLFVSHNMAAVSTLCSRAILLGNGTITFSGSTNDAVNLYLNENKDSRNIENCRIHGMGKKARILSIEPIGKSDKNFIYGNDLKFRVKIKSFGSYSKLRLVFGLFGMKEENFGYSFSKDCMAVEAGDEITCEVSIKTSTILMPNEFTAAFSVINGHMLDGYENLDIVKGYPYFELLPPSESILDNNVMNWNKVLGAIVFDGTITYSH